MIFMGLFRLPSAFESAKSLPHVGRKSNEAQQLEVCEVQGLNASRIPRHVAIIMDGNGRWAEERGESRVFGHMHGVEAVRLSVEAAMELGVRHLTLYAFSTENWSRPKEEVEALMNLLVDTLVKK
jgi:undecaprenyl diphosphate synthase